MTRRLTNDIKITVEDTKKARSLLDTFVDLKKQKTGRGSTQYHTTIEGQIKYHSRILEIFKDLFNPNSKDSEYQVYQACNKEHLWEMSEKQFSDPVKFRSNFWSRLNLSRRTLESLLKQLEEKK